MKIIVLPEGQSLNTNHTNLKGFHSRSIFYSRVLQLPILSATRRTIPEFLRYA